MEICWILCAVPEYHPHALESALPHQSCPRDRKLLGARHPHHSEGRYRSAYTCTHCAASRYCANLLYLLAILCTCAVLKPSMFCSVLFITDCCCCCCCCLQIAIKAVANYLWLIKRPVVKIPLDFRAVGKSNNSCCCCCCC